MKNLITCESVAAITLHLREVTDEYPINYSGWAKRPTALCGTVVAWDTHIPVAAARCRDCLSKLKGPAT